MHQFIKLNKYLLIIFIVWAFFSWPVFFGKTPFPSDYQVNYFAPWTSYPGDKGPVKNNAQPDIVGQIYPWRYYSINEIKQGRIPFWNPYSFGGTPHLANYQSAVLFPLNLLFFLPINFTTAWSFLVIFQPLIGGLFMYGYLRSLKITSAGSAVSAVSFMFCGFIVTWMGYATLGYAILALPFAFFCIEKYSSTQKKLWLVFLAAIFPFSFFAGHFQTSIYFSIAVLGYILHKLIFENNKKKLFPLLLFSFFGLLITMPQVMPSLEFYALSVRSEIFQKIEAIPLSYLITFFSPDFFGNPVTRNDWYGHYAEWNGYTGLITLFLAFFTIIYKRTRKTLFFIGLAVISLVLSLDTPLQDGIVSLKIPVISTSSSSRIIVIFSFSIAVLAGFGYDLLKAERKVGNVIRWILISATLISVFTFIGLLSADDFTKLIIGVKNSILPGFFALSLFFGILLIFIIKKKIIRKVIFFLFVIISAFEMLRFANKWQNFDPASNAFVNIPVLEFISSTNSYDRVLGFNSAEVAVYYRIPVLSGYDPLYIFDYGRYSLFISDGKFEAPGRSAVIFPLRGKYVKESINFLGVKYIAHKHLDKDKAWAFPVKEYSDQLTSIYDDGNYIVYENKNSFDRAFIISNSKFIKDNNEALIYLFNSDLKKTATVDDLSGVIAGNATGSAVIENYMQDYVRVRANATETAMLVLTDNYYPGWRALVNGKESNILKVNTSFRGVLVPEGESIVEFKFKPESFYYGTYAALLGLMGIISFIIISEFGVAKK